VHVAPLTGLLSRVDLSPAQLPEVDPDVVGVWMRVRGSGGAATHMRLPYTPASSQNMT